MDIFKFPLARITIWFVFGIVIGHFAELPISVVLMYFGCIYMLFIGAYISSQNHFRQKVYFGIIISVLCLFAGITNEQIHHGHFQPENYINQIKDDKTPSRFHVVIRERLKSNSYSDRFIAIVKTFDGKPSSGRILLSNYRKNEARPIRVGSNLIAIALVQKHKPPLNPAQFDYGKYLRNKSVYAQVNLKPEDFQLLNYTTKDLWYYSDAVRTRIISNLEGGGFTGDALQVTNALILGQQQEISKDVLRDYQFAGAVHILSVSGLHVGFILLFLNFVLKPLPKNRRGRILKLVIVLISLWSFAIIAGLSPSVVRSATMFSFIAVGMSIRRSTNIFHTLIVSMLLILLIEPSFLFDVGFQLSYLALFFILWLQPVLSNLWQPNNKILSYFWDILTVSFAAQIGAFPLSIYYFHQFPGLFFITNLIIIPLVSVIMFLGIAVMLMALCGFVPYWPLKLLEWSVSGMNSIIKKIATYENFIIQDIPLNFYILLSLYLVITAFVLYIKKPAFSRMVFALTSIGICQLVIFGTIWTIAREKEFIVFNIRKNTLLAERNGKEITIYHRMPERVQSSINTYKIANFAANEKRSSWSNHLFFDRYKILIIDSYAVYSTQEHPDILILSNSPKINLERLLQTCRPKIIIADASNYKTYCSRWESICTQQKIPFHNTSEKGFFRIKK